MSSDVRFREAAPWLLVVALLVFAIEGGSYLLAVGAAVVAEHRISLPRLAVLVFAFTAVLAATTPLRRRLLTPIREWVREPPDDASVRELIARVRERRPGWWRREASLLGIGALAWLTLVGVTGAVLTGWQYRRYAGGATEAMHPANTMALLVLCAVAAGVLAAAAGAVAGRESDPAAIVAAARAAPRAFLRHALVGAVRAVVAGAVGVMSAAFVGNVIERALRTLSYDLVRAAGDYWDLFEPGTLLLWISVPVVVATAARIVSFVGAKPSVPDTPRPGSGLRNARVVAVVLLLVAAPIVATTAVRVDDTGYPGAEVKSLPEGPAAALETAQSNTFDRSYRRVAMIRNDDRSSRRVRGADRSDRQYRVRQSSAEETFAQFDGEGATAVRDQPHYGSPGLLEWTAGNWSVYASSSGAFVVEGLPPDHPTPDAPWRVVRENDTALVLGVDGVAVGRAAERLPRDGEHYEVVENATLRVHLNRERGILQSTTIDATYYEVEEGNRTDRRDVNVVRRYENVGTHDVERPDALGPRRPVEWVWDFLYY